MKTPVEVAVTDDVVTVTAFDVRVQIRGAIEGDVRVMIDVDDVSTTRDVRFPLPLAVFVDKTKVLDRGNPFRGPVPDA